MKSKKVHLDMESIFCHRVVYPPVCKTARFLPSVLLYSYNGWKLSLFFPRNGSLSITLSCPAPPFLKILLSPYLGFDNCSKLVLERKDFQRRCWGLNKWWKRKKERPIWSSRLGFLNCGATAVGFVTGSAILNCNIVGISNIDNILYLTCCLCQEV